MVIFPAYWPAEVHVTGFWHKLVHRPGCHRNKQLIVVSLGSMGLMGLVKRPHTLLHILAQALAALDLVAIILTGERHTTRVLVVPNTFS